jgi:hypothetical protein
MDCHVLGGAGEERVVLIEHLFAIWLLSELHHAAAAAEGDLEVEEVLLGYLVLRQETIRDRLPAERDEGLDAGSANCTVA